LAYQHRTYSSSVHKMARWPLGTPREDDHHSSLYVQHLRWIQDKHDGLHCTAFQIKFSNIRCDSGIKLPRIPQLYLFWTVKPMCHVKPTQATSVENKAMRTLLMTITSIAWGTESPMAGFASAILFSSHDIDLLR
jgi:hypothetical protein